MDFKLVANVILKNMAELRLKAALNPDRYSKELMIAEEYFERIQIKG